MKTKGTIKRFSIQQYIRILLAGFMFWSCCLLGSSSVEAARKKKLNLSLEKCEKLILGCWKIVETNTMGELDNEVKYDFSVEGKCRKKNIFNGYAEEFVGAYTLGKKKKKEFLLHLKFESGTEETYVLFFETKDRINMTFIVDQAKLIYVLDRQHEHD